MVIVLQVRSDSLGITLRQLVFWNLLIELIITNSIAFIILVDKVDVLFGVVEKLAGEVGLTNLVMLRIAI